MKTTASLGLIYLLVSSGCASISARYVGHYPPGTLYPGVRLHMEEAQDLPDPATIILRPIILPFWALDCFILTPALDTALLPYDGIRWVIRRKVSSSLGSHARETYAVDLGDGVNLILVLVEPGSFQMGSNDGRNDEKPIRMVQITSGFWMGKTEVTQAHWRKVMGDSPSQFKGDDRPVERISWDRCVEFCRKLTDSERQIGRLPDGYVYRLPTEAEWEYAARGGAWASNTTYAGSDDINAVAWHLEYSRRRTHPVGTKEPNELGLHDMSGNVCEWVHDWYQAGYGGLSSTDPIGPQSGTNRVARGGGWSTSEHGCRVAYRRQYCPSDMLFSLGFRIVLAAPVETREENSK